MSRGLVKDNGFSLSGSVGGVSGGIKFADNALTCDSEGNCMLKDNLCFSKSCKDKKAAKDAALKAEIEAAITPTRSEIAAEVQAVIMAETKGIKDAVAAEIAASMK